jgi:hypothetical protein
MSPRLGTLSVIPIFATSKSNSTKAAYNNTDHQNTIFIYRGAGKSLARPTSQCILFDGENISFDASLVIYIYK